MGFFLGPPEGEGRESSLCLVVFSDFYASKNMGDLLIARFETAMLQRENISKMGKLSKKM